VLIASSATDAVHLVIAIEKNHFRLAKTKFALSGPTGRRSTAAGAATQGIATGSRNGLPGVISFNKLRPVRSTVEWKTTAANRTTMSTSPHETPSESSSDTPVTAERIAAFERDDGAVVIYDEREHTAWIQSSGAVGVDEAR
jgi:hypothetical protein